MTASPLTLSQTQTEQVEPSINPSGEAPLNSSDVLWLIGFITLGLFTLKLVSRVRTIKRNAAITPFNPLPCPRCRYFSGNHYLKCAVRPSDVLSSRAVDCSDYTPARVDSTPPPSVPKRPGDRP